MSSFTGEKFSRLRKELGWPQGRVVKIISFRCMSDADWDSAWLTYGNNRRYKFYVISTGIVIRSVPRDQP